jgi:Flp pilus assembly protein TadG
MDERSKAGFAPGERGQQGTERAARGGSQAGGLARLRRGLHRLWRDRRAVGTIEFALVGPIFLLLAGATIENGLVLFMQGMLDNATRDAVRVTLTGQTGTTFPTQLCNEISRLMSCSSLQYSVQTGTSFSALSSASYATYPSTVSSVAAGTFVLVKVVYTRQFVMPLIGHYLGNSTQIVSTEAFETEPF